MKGIAGGLILTSVACVLGYALAAFIPIGWVSTSIVVGFLWANTLGVDERFGKGIDLGEKHVLSLAIVLLGSQMDFSVLSDLGIQTMGLVVAIVASAVGLGYLLGPAFGVGRGLSILLGVGTGVCGASAIAAASKTLGSSKEDTGLSIAIVNSIGSVGIALMPALAIAFGFNAADSGILIGGSLQAVGHVTAAGFALGDEVGVIATVVKMARVLMLGPLVVILGFMGGKKGAGVGVPSFIIGFIALMVAVNAGLIDGGLFSFATKAALAYAMAAIGLKIRVSEVLGKGKNALACGVGLFAVQVVLCLGAALT